MFDRPGSSAAKPNAVLVGLDFGDDDYVESLAELQMLAATSGAQARELVRGKRDRPDPALYAALDPKVTLVRALRADFDSVVQDDVLGFDGHPGPFWHDAIARRMLAAIARP